MVSNARRILAGLSGAVLLLAGGCGKKSLSKTELRGVTSEIVAAAQRVTSHKSGIAIRPEVHPAGAKENSQRATDDIYVSLADASQANALKESLAGIARRHNLSMWETSSGGVSRFDLSFNGNRTHTIHVVTPLASRPRAPIRPGVGNPRLAIILDDLGYDRSAADSLLALPFALTVSVIPNLPLSTEVAEEAYRRGDQVLLHLPMESESSDVKHEDIELRVGMNAEQVQSTVSGMLETVPHVVGVNNHQGSRATADPALMETLMLTLRRHGLFFIDSRTTTATVAYTVAERSGVRAASRKVFLDDTPTKEAVLAQLNLAARDAARDGSAIAIGHPHPVTIAALAEAVPGLEAHGIRMVFASDITR